jgi:hypothetical protein
VDVGCEHDVLGFHPVSLVWHFLASLLRDFFPIEACLLIGWTALLRQANHKSDDFSQINDTKEE